MAQTPFVIRHRVRRLISVLAVLNIAALAVAGSFVTEMEFDCQMHAIQDHAPVYRDQLVDGICDCRTDYGAGTCADEDRDAREEFMISYNKNAAGPYLYYLIILFGSIFYFAFSRVKDTNHCRSCGSEVPAREIINSFEEKITAFTESTQAVTSLNPALGLGASGRGGAIGIGATTSTSHIPIKLARYQCSVKCPECQHTYSWTQNVKVRIWTSVEGVETVEKLEPVPYPFKMAY